MKKLSFLLALSLLYSAPTFATPESEASEFENSAVVIVPRLEPAEMLSMRSTSKYIKTIVDQNMIDKLVPSLGAFDIHNLPFPNGFYRSFQDGLCRRIHEEMKKHDLFLIRRGHPIDPYFEEYARKQDLEISHAVAILEKPNFPSDFHSIEWEDQMDWKAYDTRVQVFQPDLELALAEKLETFKPLYAQFTDIAQYQESPENRRVYCTYNNFFAPHALSDLLTFFKSHPKSVALVHANHYFYQLVANNRILSTIKHWHLNSTVGVGVMHINLLTDCEIPEGFTLKLPTCVRHIPDDVFKNLNLPFGSRVQLPFSCQIIGAGFFAHCTLPGDFNLQLPTDIEYIDANFMAGTQLPQDMRFPFQKLQRISTAFLCGSTVPSGCDLLFPKTLKKIDHGFLLRAILPNGFRMTFPSDVTIEQNFMRAVVVPENCQIIGYSGDSVYPYMEGSFKDLINKPFTLSAPLTIQVLPLKAS